MINHGTAIVWCLMCDRIYDVTEYERHECTGRSAPSYTLFDQGDEEP